MEVPVLSRVIGFEAELTRLHTPSLIPRFLNLSPIKLQSFWTWGALIIALLAYFSSFVSRIKYVILRLRKGTSVISQPLLQQLYFDDSEDETCSSSYSSEDESSLDEEQDEEEEYEYEYEDQSDFRVAGSSNFEETLGQRRNFSWSDFMMTGKSVVKSWDDISMPSPSVIVSAGLETSRNVALRVFDTRVGRQIPQMFAEWQQPYQVQKFTSIYYNSEDEISDDEDVNVRSVVVKDLRKITSPLEHVTESDFKTWFDSDAVIVNGDCSFENGCGSVVSRCRNAVFSYLF